MCTDIINKNKAWKEVAHIISITGEPVQLIQLVILSAYLVICWTVDGHMRQFTSDTSERSLATVNQRESYLTL